MTGDPRTIPPGGTIGIFGGGQLGRMTALAAANLGYKCHIYCPEEGSPAFQVSDAYTCAAYDDADALTAFAEAVDVVTFEFENIPAESVRLVADLVPVRPGWNVLETAQDRVAEKSFFNGIGVATAPWQAVNSREDLEHAVTAIGRPSVLKTARFGYDGKGQVKIDDYADLDAAWDAIDGAAAILEGFVTFEKEISVIVARAPNGAMAVYDPVDNVHTDHILDITTAPARVASQVMAQAMDIAYRAAGALDLVGLLAVEMFVTRDGEILVNEMAPRPHNSGHWTMDACTVSQFDQFVRAVCGLPLGDPIRHSDAIMTNLLGYDIDGWSEILAEPNACLHLYGKAEARPGRKMGHVNRLYPKS